MARAAQSVVIPEGGLPEWAPPHGVGRSGPGCGHVQQRVDFLGDVEECDPNANLFAGFLLIRRSYSPDTFESVPAMTTAPNPVLTTSSSGSTRVCVSVIMFVNP